MMFKAYSGAKREDAVGLLLIKKKKKSCGGSTLLLISMSGKRHFWKVGILLRIRWANTAVTL